MRDSRKRRQAREERNARREALGEPLIAWFDANLADRVPKAATWRKALRLGVERFEPLLTMASVRVLRIWAGEVNPPALWIGTLEAHGQRIDVLPPWHDGHLRAGETPEQLQVYLGLVASCTLASAAAEAQTEEATEALWNQWIAEAAAVLGPQGAETLESLRE
ncbi:MAG: hypothetical protein EP330_06215 [Deltaproteobacteria bacterium]|nr:MAG: hypothetical protein EP330_06215 [Deltaproteobacteria bacterium]